MRAARIWQNFASDPAIMRTHFVLGDACDLYREGLKCYEAKAYMAACICVRSSMEACLHAARRTRKVNAPQLHGPKTAQVNLGDTQWQRLLRWAANVGLLDNSLRGRVKRARKWGDLGAHLAQRKARAYRSQRKTLRMRPGLQPWSIELWPRGDAANSLNIGRDLILRIATRRWQ